MVIKCAVLKQLHHAYESYKHTGNFVLAGQYMGCNSVLNVLGITQPVLKYFKFLFLLATFHKVFKTNLHILIYEVCK